MLHHFRTKEALVTNLAVRKLKAVQDGFVRKAQSLGGQPGIGTVEHASKQFGQDKWFSRAFLVAAVENSSSLEQFQTMCATALENVRRESTDPALGTALPFAVIGVQVSQTLGLSQLAGAGSDYFQALRAAATSTVIRNRLDSHCRPISGEHVVLLYRRQVGQLL